MRRDKFAKIRLAVVFLLCLLYHEVLGGSKRPTRLIGGDRIYDAERSASPFKVLQYFVWIGKAWDCPHTEINTCSILPPCSLTNRFITWLLDKACDLETPSHLVCGGTLISSRIVQTACHCLSAFVASHYVKWQAVTLVEEWEQQRFLYMGQSNVKAFRYPIRSQSFWVHAKCARMGKPPWFLRYDIGWIVMEEPVDVSRGVRTGFWGPLDYAGPYLKEELTKFYWKVVGQRHVCLGTGFGAKQYNGSSLTQTFKFGWIQILDFTHCYEALWKSRGLQSFDNYNNSVSWACTRPLHDPFSPPYLAGQQIFGDSGAPVTCGNNYFALHISIIGLGYTVPKFRGGFYNLSRATAIYYAEEQNTVEKRRAWEAILLDTTAQVLERELRILKFPNGAVQPPVLKFSKHLGMSHSSSVSSFQSAWAFCPYLLKAIAKYNSH